MCLQVCSVKHRINGDHKIRVLYNLSYYETGRHLHYTQKCMFSEEKLLFSVHMCIHIRLIGFISAKPV